MAVQQHIDVYEVFVGNGLFRAGFEPFRETCLEYACPTSRMYYGWLNASARGHLYELSSCDDFSQAGGRPGLWLRARRKGQEATW